MTIEAGEKVGRARRKMLTRGFSNLPVQKNEGVVGVITASDIVPTFILPAEMIGSGELVVDRVAKFPGTVTDVMDKHPVILGLGASALDVARELHEHRKGACLIVNDQGAILGIITPREILPLVARPKTEKILPIYIIGFSQEDFLERSIVEEKVRRAIDRGVRIHPDIGEVSIKIKKRNREGNRIRYELVGRVVSPTKQYNVSHTGWDLLSIFDSFSIV